MITEEELAVMEYIHQHGYDLTGTLDLANGERTYDIARVSGEDYQFIKTGLSWAQVGEFVLTMEKGEIDE